MRILVINDDVSEKSSIRRMLTGHRVVIESKPRDALARMHAGERFGLVLCDMRLPGTTGVAVLAEMRQAFGVDPPLFVLTRNRDETAGSGADATLVKPFVGTELRELVATQLERSVRRSTTTKPPSQPLSETRRVPTRPASTTPR